MNKTPISILQELMVKQNTLPKYIESPSDKAGYNFLCIVNAGDVEAKGYGSNKKEAKQNSAKEALLLMNLTISDKYESTSDRNVLSSVDTVRNSVSIGYPNLPPVNFIGKLNEYASTNGKQYPVYHDDITSLNGRFVVQCQFMNLSTDGNGPNKKTAKQDSAMKMFELLRLRPLKLTQHRAFILAPKLYSCKASPVARATEIVAKIIGLQLDVVHYNLDGDHLKGEMAKINPKHTVPTLDDNGFHLWDSHAIMIYFIEKYSNKHSLYPEDVQNKALVLQRLFFEAGDLFARHREAVGLLVFGSNTDVSEEGIQAIVGNYAIVEHFLLDEKFIAGDHLTIADISIWCTLTNIWTYAPFDESKYPKIKAWCKVMEGIPYADINIEGSKASATLVNGIGEMKRKGKTV